MSEKKTAKELCIGYADAAERVRRHKRTMRENTCVERDAPCWIDLKDGSLLAEEMCDGCLNRQFAYEMRSLAMKELGKAKRAIEKYVKSVRR